MSLSMGRLRDASTTSSVVARALLSGTPPSRRRLDEFHGRRVRRLVAHAYENVPFYRETLDRAGVRPSAVRGVEDLPLLPLVRKSDLQERGEGDVLARGVDPARVITQQTSGSSGSPFLIRRTLWEDRLLGLLELSPMRALGVGRSDRVATVSLVRPPRSRPTPSFGDRLGRLWRWRLAADLRLDCREPPHLLAEKLRAHGPDVLIGFPGVLAKVADVIDANPGLRVSPRLVVTGSETLTPTARQRLAAVFDCPVVQTYASQEFRLIACECRATGLLHVWEPAVRVEVLTDGRVARPGERGTLVATALHSFAMPFIRYALGDIVVQGPERCPCGSPLRTLAEIQGREIDYFTLPGGRVLHPYELLAPFYAEGRPLLNQYQVLQEREDRIHLQIVPGPFFATHGERRLRDELTAILGPGVEIVISTVATIESEPSGKYRAFRSLVPSQEDR